MQFLPGEYRHVLAHGERGWNNGRELGAVVGYVFDVELVDQMADLLSTADDPNLRFFGRRNGQQFVQLCGHRGILADALLCGEEKLKAWFPNHFRISEAVDYNRHSLAFWYLQKPG